MDLVAVFSRLLFAVSACWLCCGRAEGLKNGNSFSNLVSAPPKLVRFPFLKTTGETLKLPEGVSAFREDLNEEQIEERSREIAESVFAQLQESESGRVFIGLTDITFPNAATREASQSDVEEQVHGELPLRELQHKGVLTKALILKGVGLLIVDFHKDCCIATIVETLKDLWLSNPGVWLIEADSKVSIRGFDSSPNLRGEASVQHANSNEDSDMAEDASSEFESYNGSSEGVTYRSQDDRRPDDPLFSMQWGLDSSPEYIDVKALGAWDLVYGPHAVERQEVVVAHIDTGVDILHPDLIGRIWVNEGEIPNNGIDDDGNGYIDDVNGWNFGAHDNNVMDRNGHGTHTAGILTAVGNNKEGIIGMARDVKLMVLRFGSGATEAAEAIEYSLRNGATISTNSWGFVSEIAGLRIAMENSQRMGQLFVCAVDNMGRDNTVSPDYPPNWGFANMIRVANVGRTGELAKSSNYGGMNVDIAAPGVDIISTVPSSVHGKLYTRKNGTSMATPLVAGVAAILKSIRPDLDAYQVKRIIMETSQPSAALKGKVISGGILDAEAAVKMALGIKEKIQATSRPNLTYQAKPNPYIPLANPAGWPFFQPVNFFPWGNGLTSGII